MTHTRGRNGAYMERRIDNVEEWKLAMTRTCRRQIPRMMQQIRMTEELVHFYWILFNI